MRMEREVKTYKKEGLSQGRLWTARIMGWIAILFMLMDGIGKIFAPAPVVEGTLALGFTEHHILAIGILGLLPTLLYIIPRTSILGALLLTAYFGGAVASQIRMDAPLFSNILFPVYAAILVWGALWLRDERVPKLLFGRD